jgi:hypothetical protein
MSKTHYWDVTSCRWKPCHEAGVGVPPPASLETDRATLDTVTTAATPTSAGPATTTTATGPMAPASGPGADVPEA